MATQAIPFLTAAQYLEIERAAEFRSEYLDGEMFAMSGATARHNSIVNNLAAGLRPQLKGRCRYYTTDLRLLIQATGLYTYPDLMVICGRSAIFGRPGGYRTLVGQADGTRILREFWSPEDGVSVAIPGAEIRLADIEDNLSAPVVDKSE